MDDIVERLKPGHHQLDAQESAELLAAVMAQDLRPAQRRRLVLAAAGAVMALGVGSVVAFGVAQDDDPDRAADGTGSPGSVIEGECQPRIRLQGTVYVGIGYLENEGSAATRVGQAELGACDDEGLDGRGAYFPRSRTQSRPMPSPGSQSLAWLASTSPAATKCTSRRACPRRTRKTSSRR